jgi:integrase/recombinase XerD
VIPKVSLFIRVGQQYLKPVASANKRIKPQYAIVDGKPTHAPSGVYYVRYACDGKRKWESVGAELDAALAAKSRLEGRPSDQASAPAPAPKETLIANRRDLSGAITTYIYRIAARKKPKTPAAYRKALEYFRESCKKIHLEEIEKEDLLQFADFLRAKPLAPRTVSNTFEHVMTFFKAQGCKIPIPKDDRPDYTQEEPETYEPEELEAMFAVCTPEERLLFRFFLMTGFREQETIYVSWKNVDATGGVVQVKHKPHYDWTPKAYKEREVPVPAELTADLLQAKPATAKPTDLIFSAPEGGPNGHMLRILKRVAKRAGLDPDSCWLHKFRATFATTALQGGVDIRTVGTWLGHSDKDLTSTMRYLRPARGAAVRVMVESIWSTKTA